MAVKDSFYYRPTLSLSLSLAAGTHFFRNSFNLNLHMSAAALFFEGLESHKPLVYITVATALIGYMIIGLLGRGKNPKVLCELMLSLVSGLPSRCPPHLNPSHTSHSPNLSIRLPREQTWRSGCRFRISGPLRRCD